MRVCYKIVLLHCLVWFTCIYPVTLYAQETNSNASGRILSDKKEALAGATITAIHEPTKNVFTTQSSADGYFHFFNLKPGGPYTILVSYTGFEILKTEKVFVNFNSSGYFLNLSNNDAVHFILKEKSTVLSPITVAALRNSKKGNKTLTLLLIYNF